MNRSKLYKMRNLGNNNNQHPEKQHSFGNKYNTLAGEKITESQSESNIESPRKVSQPVSNKKR